MGLSNIKGAIFDLAGTILEQPRRAIYTALWFFPRKYGCHFAEARFADKEPFKNVFEHYISGEHIRELSKGFSIYYVNLENPPTRLIDVSAAALQTLCDKRFKGRIAAERSAPQKNLRKLFDQLGINPLVRAVHTVPASPYANGKRSQLNSSLSASIVPPEQFVLVSDTPSDFFREYFRELSLG